VMVRRGTALDKSRVLDSLGPATEVANAWRLERMCIWSIFSRAQTAGKKFRCRWGENRRATLVIRLLGE
jgi:hypothetical protein